MKYSHLIAWEMKVKLVRYITKRLRGIEEERQDKEPGSWLELSYCVALDSGAC